MEESLKHSILPPFKESYDSNFTRYWDLHRDCLAEDSFISLTKALDSQAGALWNKEVCYFITTKNCSYFCTL